MLRVDKGLSKIYKGLSRVDKDLPKIYKDLSKTDKDFSNIYKNLSRIHKDFLRIYTDLSGTGLEGRRMGVGQSGGHGQEAHHLPRYRVVLHLVGFGVSDSGFRFSALGIRVSGLGFRVAGLGCRGLTRGGGCGMVAGGFVVAEWCIELRFRAALCISPGHSAPARKY